VPMEAAHLYEMWGGEAFLDTTPEPGVYEVPCAECEDTPAWANVNACPICGGNGETLTVAVAHVVPADADVRWLDMLADDDPGPLNRDVRPEWVHVLRQNRQKMDRWYLRPDQRHPALDNAPYLGLIEADR